MTSPGPPSSVSASDRPPLHAASHMTPELLEEAFAFIRQRLLVGPTGLGGPRTHSDLKHAVGAGVCRVPHKLFKEPAYGG